MSVEGAEMTGPEPRVEHVQTTDYYYHVRVRPREAFVALRTPIEAAEAAWEVIGEGCDVREGQLPSGAWCVESVLIPLALADDRVRAEELTRKLVTRLKS